MGSSIRLFSIRGIDLRLHITFPLILIWAGLQFGMRAGNLEGALFRRNRHFSALCIGHVARIRA